jgi:serine/threonine protein kinase
MSKTEVVQLEAASPTNEDREWLLATLLERTGQDGTIDVSKSSLEFESLSRDEKEQLHSAQEIVQVLAQLRNLRCDTDSPTLPSLPLGSDPLHRCERGSVDRNFIGRYEILRVAGNGGFAVVYHARDPVLGRDVALKVLLPERLKCDIARLRFQREAKLAALLSHPNIVSVYEAGSIENADYLSMQWVNGVNLSAWLQGRKASLDEREVARAVQVMAQAVSHAHDRGILHRDLKPANILIESVENESDNMLWYDRLRIADFGVAVALSPSTNSISNDEIQDSLAARITDDGTAVGTPAYMSPEQARSDTNLHPSSDIWSLGVILYEMLTGVCPFHRSTYAATLRALEQETAKPPCSLRVSLSLDLQAICLKCLEFRPEDRYKTAFELAEDLGRFLRLETVSARPPSRITSGVRWARRNPILAGSLGAVLGSLVVSSAVVSLALMEALQERNHAKQALLREQSAMKQETKARQIAEDAKRTAEQEVVRNREQLDFLANSLASLNPEQGGIVDPSAADLLRSTRKSVDNRFQDDPVTKMEILRRLAVSFLGIGLFHDGIECRTEILRLSEQQVGRMHESTIRELALLALAQDRAGLHHESLKSRRDQIQRLQNLKPREPRKEYEAVWRASQTLLELGGTEGSEAWNWIEQCNESNEAYRTSLLKIATMRRQGRMVEAIAESEKEIEAHRRISGLSHSNTLVTMGRHADLLSDSGDTDAAIRLSRQMIQMVAQGNNYSLPLVHSIRASHGRLLLIAKRNLEARQFLEDALSSHVPRFGPTHPSSIRLKRFYAKALWELGEKEQAIAETLRAHELCVSTVGEHHSESLNVGYQLATFYSLQGRLEESVRVAKQSYSIARKHLNSAEPLTQMLRDQVILTLQQSKRFEEAIDYLQESSQSLTATVDFSHSSERQAMAWARNYLHCIHGWVHVGCDGEANETLNEFLRQLDSLPVQKSRIYPVHCEAIVVRAWLALRAKDHHEAIEAARVLLNDKDRLQPWASMAHVIEGTANAELGRAERGNEQQTQYLERLEGPAFERSRFDVRWLILSLLKVVQHDCEKANRVDQANKTSAGIDRLERILHPSSLTSISYEAQSP